MGIYIDSMTVHRRRFLRLAVSYLQNMPNQILNELAFQLNVLDYDEGYVIGQQFKETDYTILIEFG